MRDVVLAFVAVAVAVVTMCLCWLLLLPRLTLVQSRHLLPLSLFALHCNNNKQPPNAVIFAIQSTRPTWKIRAIYACMKYSSVCLCVCVPVRVWVCLSLALPVPPTPAPSPFPIPIAFQSPQLCVLPAPLFGISTGESPKTRRLFILLARKFMWCHLPPPLGFTCCTTLDIVVSAGFSFLHLLYIELCSMCIL